ncbi:MAG: NADH-quinone oxidoreductase subunit N, partial [Bacteroidia bacterium]
MKITDLLLMRHELILIAIVLSLLVMKIAWGKNESSKSFMLLINIMLVINFLAGLTWNSVGELFGGMYVTDHTLSMEKNLLNLGTLIISLQAYDWLKNHKDSAEFYLILLSTLLGMFFMISSGHLLMFYIGLELATLPLSALASFNKHDKKSAEAGLKMILMSGFSTAILLFGISLLYGTSGSLLFSNLAVTVTGNSLQILAFIFLLSGFAFKISIVPFHLWTADVYEGAPISITSYLSVISKSAVILIFVTILYKVFSQVSDIWGTILLVTSV